MKRLVFGVLLLGALFAALGGMLIGWRLLPAQGPAATPAATPRPVPQVSNQATGTLGYLGAFETVQGPLRLASGQTVRNKHITSAHGPCLLVPPGVRDVVIEDNEIGPCGSAEPDGTGETMGVSTIAASNITVRHNVFHDVSSGAVFTESRHPIVVDRNLFFNLLGGGWDGQAVMFRDVRGGSGQSRISCNVIDGRLGIPVANPARPVRVGDNINLYDALGTPEQPILIEYNRIRGPLSGGVESGSGMMLNDGHNQNETKEAGWVIAQHNTIVLANGAASGGIAGGHDTIYRHNIIDGRGEQLSTYTGEPFIIRNFSTNRACYNHSFIGNRATRGRIWAYVHTGVTGEYGIGSGLEGPGISACTWTASGNDLDDAELTAAKPDDTFNKPYPACD